MKRVAIYCRVSGNQQAKEETIKTQIGRLKEFYKNPKMYADNPGNSATLDRAGLTSLREDAKVGKFNIIAVYSIDRLSREPAHQWILMEEFKKEGIELRILDKKIEDTPEGEFGAMVMSAAAKLEKMKIIQRMSDGRNRKVYKEGRFLGTYPAFGYDLVRKTQNKDGYWKVNLEETQIIKTIFKVFVEEQSIRGATVRLYKMGIRGRGRFSGKPSVFRPQNIRKMLSNESYIGNFYYGKTMSNGSGGKTSRTEKEWKLIKIPAIIDKPIFYRTQEILAERREHHLKKTKYDYLCQGLIKCSHCGKRYYGKRYSPREGAIYLYYVCPQRDRRYLDQPRCHSRIINVKKLDNEVWEYLSSLIQDTNRVKKAIRAIEERRTKNKESYKKLCDKLREEKVRIKKQKKNLILALTEEKIKRSIEKKDFEEVMEELNEKELLIDKQIIEAEVELKRMATMSQMEREIERLCVKYKSIITDATIDEKKLIIRRWVKEITLLDDGTTLVKVRIPELEKPVKMEIKSPNTPLAIANSGLWYKGFTNK